MEKPTLIISFSPPHGQGKTVDVPPATIDTDAAPSAGLENIAIGADVTSVVIRRGAEGGDFAKYEEQGAEAQLILADLHVSRARHARIRWDGLQGVWVLEDCDSTNGTWVGLGTTAQKRVWGSSPHFLPAGHHSINAGYDLEVIVG